MRTALLNPALCCLTGTLVGVGKDGRAFVDFPGNLAGPIEARLAFPGAPPAAPATDTPVLLAFEDGDPSLPFILGFIAASFAAEPSANIVMPDRSQLVELNVDGRQLRFTATDQLVLQCGQGSITVTSDGSIEIKGTRIVSRASGIHKIRGAAVRIN
jgi:hypothetical protein